MLRVQSNTELVGFTEFEEVIHFDDDDPDFPQGFNTIPTMPIILGVRRDMSIASVHPAGLHSTHGSLPTLSHSVEDITECNWSPPTTPAIHHHHHQSDHVLTIEELRLHMTSCFTCGVSWNDSHVSLDCSECGGYALDRPCPECEGACGAVWKRDLSMSHACSKARWQGECALKQQQQKNIPPTSSDNNNQKTSSKAVVNSVSQELSSKLEKLSANS